MCIITFFILVFLIGILCTGGNQLVSSMPYRKCDFFIFWLCNLLFVNDLTLWIKTSLDVAGSKITFH